MDAEHFLNFRTIQIPIQGAVAFSFSTVGGILFAKILNLFLKKKINPCIGAAGVSAVPMAARVVQKFVSDHTDGRVNPLMPAMGPNVAGVIGSAVAAGVFRCCVGLATATGRNLRQLRYRRVPACADARNCCARDYHHDLHLREMLGRRQREIVHIGIFGQWPIRSQNRPAPSRLHIGSGLRPYRTEVPANPRG
jgi:hypothetical protein